MNFLNSLSGNAEMMTGLVGVIGVLGLTILGPKLPILWEKLKSYLPSLKPSPKPDTIPALLSNYPPHEIVDYLISYSQERTDEDGVQIMVSYGKHLYDLRNEVSPVKVAA